MSTRVGKARSGSVSTSADSELPKRSSTPVNETLLILFLSAVQFINILDFMMVMPLGPDFAQSLAIPISKLGWVGGSYTVAACVAGLGASFFLDKFDRKWGLVVAFFGVSLATLLGGLSWDLNSLLFSRVIAGFCAGPAVSLLFSILSDVIPPARRGKAMGSVMASFSLASIVGVPLGLQLATWGGWHAPFFAVGGLGLLLCAWAAYWLPNFRGHLAKPSVAVPLSLFLGKRFRRSFLLMALGILGTFLLVPNLSAYLQFNLGWPREKLGLLYMVGGILSLLTTRYVGIWVDRKGGLAPALASAGLITFALLTGFIFRVPAIPIVVVFALFMVGSSARMVVLTTLSSQLPAPELRARFLSFQSAVTHLASATGAFASTFLLSESSSGALIGIPRVSLVVLALVWAVPLFLPPLERSLREERN